MLLEGIYTDPQGKNHTVPVKVDIDGNVVVDSTGGKATLATDPPVVAIGASSQKSSAFAANTTRIIPCPTVACWIRIGADPTAEAGVVGNIYLPADAPYYPIEVTPGDKVAVIQAGAETGFLSIVEAE